MDQLDSVLPRADITAMVLPGGPETDGLMNEERLRKLKKGSYLINVGRGKAIELPALKKVLDEGILAGAALDVTEPEPLPAEDSLWTYPNVIITPHVAGNFHLPDILEQIVEISCDNLRAHLAGEPLRNVVDFSTGYKK